MSEIEEEVPDIWDYYKDNDYFCWVDIPYLDDVVQIVSERMGFSKRTAKILVRAFFQEIACCLVEFDSVVFPHFGKFVKVFEFVKFIGHFRIKGKINEHSERYII